MKHYPFAALLRHRDNLAVLEVGHVEAETDDEAYDEAIKVAKSIKDANPLLKSLEIVKTGKPITG